MWGATQQGVPVPVAPFASCPPRRSLAVLLGRKFGRGVLVYPFEKDGGLPREMGAGHVVTHMLRRFFPVHALPFDEDIQALRIVIHGDRLPGLLPVAQEGLLQPIGDPHFLITLRLGWANCHTSL